jgi:hypothetical protein
VAGTTGGSSCDDDGKYDRKRLAHASASSSVSTAWSTAPLLVWICQPPSSSLVSFCPMPATTGGPATNMAEVLVMTE